MNLNLELASWHTRNLRRNHRVHAEVGQRSSDQATGEGHKLGTGLKILSVLARLGQELETVVLEDVHSLVVGPQVVDLFPENSNPEIFANELEEVKLVLEFWIILGKPLNESVASIESKELKLGRC